MGLLNDLAMIFMAVITGSLLKRQQQRSIRPFMKARVAVLALALLIRFVRCAVRCRLNKLIVTASAGCQAHLHRLALRIMGIMALGAVKVGATGMIRVADGRIDLIGVASATQLGRRLT